MHILGKILPLLFFCGTLCAQNVRNPVLPRVADAGVMKHNGKYYIGGVSTDGDFYVSDDLVHWEGPVHVVSMDNDWTRGTGAGNNQIHADHICYLNGMFHLYWSVNYWGRDRHAVHIAHAQSKAAMGPYVEPDRKHWMDNRIDPMVFKDDDGQLYMYMVRFTDGNAIWGRRMKNPAEFSGEPVLQFTALPNTWENMDHKVVEGPWVMKYRDRYYMMYNANHTSTAWGNYKLGVAEAASPLSFQSGGKYGHPVLESNQTQLEEDYVDLLRYGDTCNPLFAYTESRPEKNWKALSYDDSGWEKGEAGFSSCRTDGASFRRMGTRWDSSALWLRKRFLVRPETGNLALRVIHDGDTRIYLNGTLIYAKRGRDCRTVNLDKRSRAALKEGTNLLAVETGPGISRLSGIDGRAAVPGAEGTDKEGSRFFDVALFDMKGDLADDMLMTPGQPNILRGPNGFEWWLIYMANRNAEPRGQYIDRVQFFGNEMYVDGITGPHTAGCHPEPALPAFRSKKETSAFGTLRQERASVAYLFETGVRTEGEAGVIAWWKDADNHAGIGLDAGSHCWYLRTCVDGREKRKSYALPADFQWGVYHHIRIERNGDVLKVWIDEVPAPGEHVFTGVIPADKGLPGVYDETGDALFEGAVYTIGFDNVDFQLPADSGTLKGDFLEDYEYSFQWSGCSENSVTGTCPIYIDEENFVKVRLNGMARVLEVSVVREGISVLEKAVPLRRRRTVYPDVKYTDSIEKCYLFNSPVYMEGICLNRQDADYRSVFEKNMFDKFTIDFLRDGEWHPLCAQNVTLDEHPAYNRLDFPPLKADGLRFINRNPEDLDRHIYKIVVCEGMKASYNFRAVRRKGKLYLFLDGKELAELDVRYPASRIGFCSEKGEMVCTGLLYYHIGTG